MPAMFRRSTAVMFLLFAFPAVFAGEPAPASASVGGAAIAPADIELRARIEAKDEKNLDKTVALATLINDALIVRVAAAFEQAPVKDEISALEQRLGANEKSAEAQNRAKGIFKNDEAYRRIVLAPRIAEQKLRTLYTSNPKFHEQAHASIKKAAELLDKGKTAAEAAAESNLVLRTFETGVGDVAELGGEQGSLLDVVRLIQNVDFRSRILEDENSLRVLRLTVKPGNRWQVEVISASKTAFEAWFQKVAVNVPIVVDAHSAGEMKTRLGGVFWVKNINTAKQGE